MQGKGAGPVNRVELESQVLCAALRQSSHVKDKIGTFTSVRELSHLFPDLLPPPERDDEQSNSNKSNYYALLNIKPQTAANGVLASYLRAVRRFLRTRKVNEGRIEYSNILNAGFVLRKPRLRLSHDLVVARRWLHEESGKQAAAPVPAAEVTADQIAVVNLRPQGAPPKLASPPQPAFGERKDLPLTAMPPPLPVQNANAAPALELLPAPSLLSQNAGESAKPQVLPSDAVPQKPERPAPAVATRTEGLPAVKPAALPSTANFIEPPPLSPLAAKLAQAADPAARDLLPPGLLEAARQAEKPSRPIVKPEAPPPPRYESAPGSQSPPLTTSSDAKDAGGVLPAAARAHSQLPESKIETSPSRPPGRISKEAAFVFDESQLRKPSFPDEKPVPTLILLLEAAQVIGSVEVQALKAQMERAPNVPMERHILNAGYISADELASVKLGENLLQRGKITMAQFQVAFYDERYSGLRMAESLQVRGWLSVEVRNAIDEWKNKGT